MGVRRGRLERVGTWLLLAGVAAGAYALGRRGAASDSGPQPTGPTPTAFAPQIKIGVDSVDLLPDASLHLDLPSPPDAGVGGSAISPLPASGSSSSPETTE